MRGGIGMYSLRAKDQTPEELRMRQEAGREHAKTVRGRFQASDLLKMQAKELLDQARDMQAQWELARRQHEEAAKLVLSLGSEMRALRAKAADTMMAAEAAAAYGRGPNFGRERVER